MRFLICSCMLIIAPALVGCGSSKTDATQVSAAVPAPPAAASGAGDSALSVSAGKKIFEGQCIACHGKNGKGLNRDTPDLTDPDWQAAASDARMLHVIANGHMRMPPFKDKLTEQQQQEVVSFIRTLAAEAPVPAEPPR